MNTCFASHVVVILGMSADDTSIGGWLERLWQSDFDAGEHFWITDRIDLQAREFCEQGGVSRITYPSGAHDYVNIGLTMLLESVSRDEPVKEPVVYTEGPEAGNALPSEAEILRSMETNDIRKVLNRHVQWLLNNSEDVSSDYERFCEDYDEAIDKSWYLSVADGRNILFDYKLLNREARGAFGVVYRGESPDGSSVAIKVLLEDVRRDPGMLQAFRQGVKSMGILAKREVPGMVPYLASSEIPAFVVMDWIEGPNLEQAVEGRFVKEWSDLLAVGIGIAETVRRGHVLPERVLHRDLRPSNVMLKDWYQTEEIDVVLLDFDLSWHKGASAMSVLPKTAATGYLAPEQLSSQGPGSTRSTAVDSFGIGMTFFFMASASHPSAGQHAFKDWKESVIQACSRPQSTSWKSLANRFCRLILSCTRERAGTRPDLTQIINELHRLKAAHQGELSPWPDLIAEEILARVPGGHQYMWDEDNASATIDFVSGASICLAGRSESQELELQVSWIDKGDFERGKRAAWLSRTVGQTTSVLRKGGWTVSQTNSGLGDLRIVASVGVPVEPPILDAHSRTLDSIVNLICT